MAKAKRKTKAKTAMKSAPRAGRFTFIGDPNDKGSGPEMYSFMGMDFPKGKSVKVTAQRVMAKLRGNSHFKEAAATSMPAMPATPESDADPRNPTAPDDPPLM